MSDRIQVEITAKDNASKVFGQVGSAGKKMGADLKASNDQLKASNDQLRKSIEDEARAAEKASAPHRNLTQSYKDMGVAVGVAAAGMALAGQAFRNNEIAVQTLGRTYGEAGQQLVEFAEHIQDTTNFSNDAAIAAANSFGTLARNYGLTVDQIQQLISVSADLAATSGMSLESAAQRVQAAIRGEAESAEALGLTMNQMAIDHDNVTFSMTNQEAAAFRLNALLTQTTFATGAAAEQADTAYGSFVDLRDGVQDAAQSFGEFLGPVGELGAFMADNAIQVAVFGAGLVKLVQGAAAARTALIALSATHSSIALLGAAMGPVGIVAAAGLAAVAIYKFADSIDEAIVPAVELAEQEIADLEQTMRELYAAGNTLGALAERGVDLFPGIVEGTERMAELQNAIATTNSMIGQMGEEAAAQAQADIERWTNELIDLALQYGSLDDSMVATTLTTEEVTAATDAFNSILRNTEEGAALQQEALQGLVDAYDLYVESGGEAGISAETFAETVILLAGSTDTYNESATEAATATDEWTASTEKGAEAALEMADALARSMTLAGRGPAGTEGMLSTFELWESQLTETDEAALELADTLSTTLAQAGSGLMGTRGMLTAFELWESQLTETEQAALDLADTLSSTLAAGGSGSMGLFGLDAILAEQEAEAIRVTIENLTGDLTRAFDAVRASYTQTTDALENGFRVIVGNTNAIADQAQGVADWATELIDVEGTYSKLDDLLANNAITLGEYNAAQQAHNSIIADNALIQEDILSIQAQQAPVLAELTARQAEYIDSVAGMDTEQQTLALAYMDTATAMQALELAQVAASQAPGFESLIEGAIAANPFLEAILTDMGIISRGANGELVINTTGMTEMEALTTAIEALNRTFTTMLVIEVDDSQLQSVMNGGGSSPMSGAALRGESGGGMAFNVVMTADNSDVTNKLSESTTALNTWASSSGNAAVLADNQDALSKLDTAQDNLSTWGSSSGSASVDADDNATGVINSVSALLAGLDGDSATTYINTVYTTTYQTVGTPPAAAFGGVINNYATGGSVTARMAEYGPEMLHFPLGGTAIAPRDGLYTVPIGTYVDTAPATAAKMSSNFGGFTLNMTINGNVGVDDIAEQVTRKIVPALQQAANQHLRSFGL